VVRIIWHKSRKPDSGIDEDHDLAIKNLIVIGENFSEGAMILVNGEPQVTRNDSDNPSTRLIAKRTGNAIANDTFVTIQVQSAGSLTNKFTFDPKTKTWTSLIRQQEKGESKTFAEEKWTRK